MKFKWVQNDMNHVNTEGIQQGILRKENHIFNGFELRFNKEKLKAHACVFFFAKTVRDAAARLPNGEGTRAEICELLKDSQFLAPDVTSAQVRRVLCCRIYYYNTLVGVTFTHFVCFQVNTVVSGALDRLHYEKDPCVKYDIGRKLWIYLHRDRSQEEFGEQSWL